MSDDIIIDNTANSPKFLSGIDSLYFHVKVNYDDYSKFYNKSLLTGSLVGIDNIEMQSNDYNSQYTNYLIYSNFFTSEKQSHGGFSPHHDTKPVLNFEAFTIRFKNLNQKDNLESINIQMRSSYMNMIGYQMAVNSVYSFIQSLGLKVLDTKVQRVDLNTYVFNHNFEYLNYDLFSTRIRKSGTHFKEYKKSGVLETFYLGNSESKSLRLRIYNKTKELNSLLTSNYEQGSIKQILIIEKFKKKYPGSSFPGKDFWNVEFQLKRDLLKQYSIDTIEDLFEKVNSLHSDLTTNRIRLLEREKDIFNNSRIQSSLIWSLISQEYDVFRENSTQVSREAFKVYKKDYSYLYNRIIDFELDNDTDLIDNDVIELLEKLKYKLEKLK